MGRGSGCGAGFGAGRGAGSLAFSLFFATTTGAGRPSPPRPSIHHNSPIDTAAIISASAPPPMPRISSSGMLPAGLRTEGTAERLPSFAGHAGSSSPCHGAATGFCGTGPALTAAAISGAGAAGAAGTAAAGRWRSSVQATHRRPCASPDGAGRCEPGKSHSGCAGSAPVRADLVSGGYAPFAAGRPRRSLPDRFPSARCPAAGNTSAAAGLWGSRATCDTGRTSQRTPNRLRRAIPGASQLRGCLEIIRVAPCVPAYFRGTTKFWQIPLP